MYKERRVCYRFSLGKTNEFDLTYEGHLIFENLNYCTVLKNIYYSLKLFSEEIVIRKIISYIDFFKYLQFLCI